MNKINFVGGDKLSPVFKHGFLRSEENVFPAIFLHTKCVWENIFLYNFEYFCMVGSITIHAGRCYCHILPNTLCFVADVIALADVIENFEIVGREDQNLMRTIKEALYIRVNDPSLNRNIGKYHLPHTWDEVLFNISELKLKNWPGK